MRSHLATSKPGRGGRRYAPRVFTEYGVAMLSSVLRSEKAIQINIEIIRAFVRLRRLIATPGELNSLVQQLTQIVNLHDNQIRQLTQILQQMLQPPPPPDPNRRIGFHPTPDKKD